MKSSNTKDLSELEEELRDYEGEDKVISSHEMARTLQEEKRPIEIKSGIQTLDECIGGFEGGELSVISGLTGNGKTLFDQTLTRNFADQGIKSLWFSYEVMPANFLKAFGEDLPLFYMPARLTENAIDWISTRISEAILKYEIRAVFVDHLHFIVEMSRNSNLSIEIGAVMRAIKKMAVKFNIAFFLIAHPTKVKPDMELGIGDIRDSSFVAQEADNVFLIWRLLKKENQAILKIAKNRGRGVLEKKITLRKVGNFLEEVPRPQN
jgi:replicative DNA helicase